MTILLKDSARGAVVEEPVPVPDYFSAFKSIASNLLGSLDNDLITNTVNSAVTGAVNTALTSTPVLETGQNVAKTIPNLFADKTSAINSLSTRVSSLESAGGSSGGSSANLADYAKSLNPTLTGVVTVTGQIIAGDTTSIAPVALTAAEATVSGNTSRRATINLGLNWQIGQDSNVNGTKDFFLYSSSAGLVATVSPSTGVWDFKAAPTYQGSSIWSDARLVPQSKAINFRQKKFNLADYDGADPSGSGSATSMAGNRNALLAALADIKAQTFSGTLVLPNGRFVLNQTVEDYALPHGIDVEGSANTELYFQGLSGGNGLGLGTSSGADGRVRVRGLRLIGRNASGGNPGTLIALYGGGAGAGVSIDGLWIDCDTSFLPTNYLLIKNPASSGNIRGIDIEGAQGSYGTSGTGISIYSDILAPDTTLHDCFVRRVGTAVNVVMGQIQNVYTLEGVSFRDCVVLGVQTGLNLACGWYKTPGYSWTGGHVNAQQYCFRLNNNSHFSIDNVNAQLDINNNPQAIVFGTDALGIHVTNSRFGIVDQIRTGKTKPDVSGIVAGSGCSLWSVLGNHFANFTQNSACVWGQSESSGIFAKSNKKFASGSTSGAMLVGTTVDDGNNLIFS